MNSCRTLSLQSPSSGSEPTSDNPALLDIAQTEDKQHCAKNQQNAKVQGDGQHSALAQKAPVQDVHAIGGRQGKGHRLQKIWQAAYRNKQSGSGRARPVSMLMVAVFFRTINKAGPCRLTRP